MSTSFLDGSRDERGELRLPDFFGSSDDAEFVLADVVGIVTVKALLFNSIQ